MNRRCTLLEEVMTKGLRSPVAQKMLFDLCIALLPLILISLARS